MLNGLDLFSGIGGISLALAPWVRPVAYCENDRFAQSVLLSRMSSGDIPFAPIWDDITTLRAEHLPAVDAIYGGFPCQDISTAGAGAGLEGKRSGLVFELLRLVGECRPRFVFLENVPALAVRGLDRLLLEFDALGYDARWTIVSAAEMGAPHLRERIWILAHANGLNGWDQWEVVGRDKPKVGQWETKPEHDGCEKSLADSNCVWKPQLAESRHRARNWTIDRSKEMANAQSLGSLEGGLPSGSKPQYSLSDYGNKYRRWNSQWETEPHVGRVAHGVSARVDRLRGLGNSVVPQAAREAFMRLMGMMN